MSTPPLFKWRRFQSDIILLNVRWYSRYALSYRDLEEMMRERGIDQWIMPRLIDGFGNTRSYLDKRIRPNLQPTNFRNCCLSVS